MSHLSIIRASCFIHWTLFGSCAIFTIVATMLIVAGLPGVTVHQFYIYRSTAVSTGIHTSVYLFNNCITGLPNGSRKCSLSSVNFFFDVIANAELPPTLQNHYTEMDSAVQTYKGLLVFSLCAVVTVIGVFAVAYICCSSSLSRRLFDPRPISTLIFGLLLVAAMLWTMAVFEFAYVKKAVNWLSDVNHVKLYETASATYLGLLILNTIVAWVSTGLSILLLYSSSEDDGC